MNSKTVKRLLFISILIMSPAALHAGFLMGLNFSLHNVGKTAKGWYRTPASSTNVEVNYKENMFYFGPGLMFEVGLAPGQAGMRITPTMYNASSELNSSSYTVHLYDMLGFSNDQSVRLASLKPSKLKIHELAIGTGLIFKYNSPVSFTATTPVLKNIKMILETINPWVGMGPMQFTFSRYLEAVVDTNDASKSEFTRLNYTDFYFLLGGGFNIELNKTISKVPQNIIISFEFMFSMNLTPENDATSNDDYLNYDQTGFMFSIGAGYRL